MKTLIIIFLLISIKVSGQTDSIHTYRIDKSNTRVGAIIYDRNTMYIRDKMSPSVTIWDDNGEIELTGDTLSIIRMLLKKDKEADEEILKLHLVIGKGVGFLNTVPDVYKTTKSKSWVSYWGELRKLGYYKE